MKLADSTIGILLLAAALLPAAGRAASVEARWEAVTLDVEGKTGAVSSYILYFGTAPRPAGVVNPADGTFAYDQQVNVGATTTRRLDGLEGGRTYYFAVAALDAGGNRSDYSAEVVLGLPSERDGGPDSGTVETGAGADPGPNSGSGDSGGPETGSRQGSQGGGSCASGGARGPGLVGMLILVLGVARRRSCR